MDLDKCLGCTYACFMCVKNSRRYVFHVKPASEKIAVKDTSPLFIVSTFNFTLKDISIVLISDTDMLIVFPVAFKDVMFYFFKKLREHCFFFIESSFYRKDKLQFSQKQVQFYADVGEGDASI